MLISELLMCFTFCSISHLRDRVICWFFFMYRFLIPQFALLFSNSFRAENNTKYPADRFLLFNFHSIIN